ADVAQKRRVLFLGNELAARIFGKGVDPIGKSVVVDGLPFTVVGVLRKKFQDSSNNGPDAERAVVPYSTFRTIWGNRFVSHLIVQPHDASRGPLVKAELYRVLGRKYRFEAMTIAVSGGLVGLVTAALIVMGVDAIPTAGNPAMQYILSPKLSWPIALICVGILIGVGLMAGILPARRAAAVDPVESLRYE